jgi:hypothetical protein
MAYPFFARRAVAGSRLIHVDTHVDCSYFRQADREALSKLAPENDVREFVELGYSINNRIKSPVGWGNWIPALIDMHPSLFREVDLVCHQRAAPLVLRDLPMARECGEDILWSDSLPGTAHLCFSIDVDYYYDSTGDDYSVRPDYPDPVGHFNQCLSRVAGFPFSLIFVALSPSCCGGWREVMPFIHSLDQLFDLALAREVEKCL